MKTSEPRSDGPGYPASAWPPFCPGRPKPFPPSPARYKLSCTTCHAPFPRLKAFGEEFAGNGFIIPEEEKDRDFISAGDDLLKLNKTFPIAVRFDAYGVDRERQRGHHRPADPLGPEAALGRHAGQERGLLLLLLHGRARRGGRSRGRLHPLQQPRRIAPSISWSASSRPRTR